MYPIESFIERRKGETIKREAGPGRSYQSSAVTAIYPLETNSVMVCVIAYLEIPNYPLTLAYLVKMGSDKLPVVANCPNVKLNAMIFLVTLHCKLHFFKHKNITVGGSSNYVTNKFSCC